jgi:hypothetical protein
MTGNLREDVRKFVIISRRILLKMRNISGKFLEVIKEHVLC